MKSNINVTIENTAVNENYALTSDVINDLYQNTDFADPNSIFYLISNAFTYGYAMGSRAEQEAGRA